MSYQTIRDMKKGIEYYSGLNINQKIEVRNSISKRHASFGIIMAQEFESKIQFLDWVFIFDNIGFGTHLKKINYLHTFKK